MRTSPVAHRASARPARHSQRHREQCRCRDDQHASASQLLSLFVGRGELDRASEVLPRVAGSPARAISSARAAGTRWSPGSSVSTASMARNPTSGPSLIPTATARLSATMVPGGSPAARRTARRCTSSPSSRRRALWRGRTRARPGSVRPALGRRASIRSSASLITSASQRERSWFSSVTSSPRRCGRPGGNAGAASATQVRIGMSSSPDSSMDDVWG